MPNRVMLHQLRRVIRSTPGGYFDVAFDTGAGIEHYALADPWFRASTPLSSLVGPGLFDSASIARLFGIEEIEAELLFGVHHTGGSVALLPKWQVLATIDELVAGHEPEMYAPTPWGLPESCVPIASRVN